MRLMSYSYLNTEHKAIVVKILQMIDRVEAIWPKVAVFERIFHGILGFATVSGYRLIAAHKGLVLSEAAQQSKELVWLRLICGYLVKAGALRFKLRLSIGESNAHRITLMDSQGNEFGGLVLESDPAFLKLFEAAFDSPFDEFTWDKCIHLALCEIFPEKMTEFGIAAGRIILTGNNPRKSASSPVAALLTKKHILVLDDDADARKANCHILEALGYMVTTAITTAEAITYLKICQFDLIIADEILRGDSIRSLLCKEINGIPVLFNSSEPGGSDFLESLQKVAKSRKVSLVMVGEIKKGRRELTQAVQRFFGKDSASSPVEHAAESNTICGISLVNLVAFEPDHQKKGLRLAACQLKEGNFKENNIRMIDILLGLEKRFNVGKPDIAIFPEYLDSLEPRGAFELMHLRELIMQEAVNQTGISAGYFSKLTRPVARPVYFIIRPGEPSIRFNKFSWEKERIFELNGFHLGLLICIEAKRLMTGLATADSLENSDAILIPAASGSSEAGRVWAKWAHERYRVPVIFLNLINGLVIGRSLFIDGQGHYIPLGDREAILLADIMPLSPAPRASSPAANQQDKILIDIGAGRGGVSLHLVDIFPRARVFALDPKYASSDFVRSTEFMHERHPEIKLIPKRFQDWRNSFLKNRTDMIVWLFPEGMNEMPLREIAARIASLLKRCGKFIMVTEQNNTDKDILVRGLREAGIRVVLKNDIPLLKLKGLRGIIDSSGTYAALIMSLAFKKTTDAENKYCIITAHKFSSLTKTSSPLGALVAGESTQRKQQTSSPVDSSAIAQASRILQLFIRHSEDVELMAIEKQFLLFVMLKELLRLGDDKVALLDVVRAKDSRFIGMLVGLHRNDGELLYLDAAYGDACRKAIESGELTIRPADMNDTIVLALWDILNCPRVRTFVATMREAFCEESASSPLGALRGMRVTSGNNAIERNIRRVCRSIQHDFCRKVEESFANELAEDYPNRLCSAGSHALALILKNRTGVSWNLKDKVHLRFIGGECEYTEGISLHWWLALVINGRKKLLIDPANPSFKRKIIIGGYDVTMLELGLREFSPNSVKKFVESLALEPRRKVEIYSELCRLSVQERFRGEAKLALLDELSTLSLFPAVGYYADLMAHVLRVSIGRQRNFPVSDAAILAVAKAFYKKTACASSPAVYQPLIIENSGLGLTVAFAQLNRDSAKNNTRKMASLIQRFADKYAVDLFIFPEYLDWEGKSLEADLERRERRFREVLGQRNSAIGFCAVDHSSTNYWILLADDRRLNFRKYSWHIENRIFEIRGKRIAVFICSECSDVLGELRTGSITGRELRKKLKNVNLIIIPGSAFPLDVRRYAQGLNSFFHVPTVFINLNLRNEGNSHFIFNRSSLTLGEKEEIVILRPGLAVSSGKMQARASSPALLAYKQLEPRGQVSWAVSESDIGKGLDALVRLYSEIVIEDLKGLRNKAARLLFVGAGRGRVILDILTRFPGNNFQIYSINEKNGWLYDMAHIMGYLNPYAYVEYGSPEELLTSKNARAKKFADKVVALFERLHSHHYAVNIAGGRNLGRLPRDFDRIIICTATAIYISSYLACLTRLFRMLKTRGLLYAEIRDVFLKGDERISKEVFQRIRRLGVPRMVEKLPSDFQVYAIYKTPQVTDLELPLIFIKYRDLSFSGDIHRPTASSPLNSRTVLQPNRVPFSKPCGDIYRSTVSLAAVGLVRVTAETKALPSVAQAMTARWLGRQDPRVIQLDRYPFIAGMK
jgi:predicted amidohydrolase/CheY-like chemotaxis protein